MTRSARRGVIPTPSARFSPLTTQASTPSSARRAGRRASSAFRPGAPTTSATKRIFNARGSLQDAEGGRGVDLDRDVVPAVARVTRERLALDRADVDHRAQLGRAG